MYLSGLVLGYAETKFTCYFVHNHADNNNNHDLQSDWLKRSLVNQLLVDLTGKNNIEAYGVQ